MMMMTTASLWKINSLTDPDDTDLKCCDYLKVFYLSCYLVRRKYLHLT